MKYALMVLLLALTACDKPTPPAASPSAPVTQRAPAPPKPPGGAQSPELTPEMVKALSTEKP